MLYRIMQCNIMLVILLSLHGQLLAAAGNGDLRKFVVSVAASGGKAVSESQQAAATGDAAALPEGRHNISLLEEFRSDETWFLSLQATDQRSVDAYLAELDVEPLSVYESLFVNSPELGGGPKAGSQPQPDHNVYMIQRAIPGIGLAPLEKKVAVSKGSQKIIDSMGGTSVVEWDHSFLTTEGTFCVYRAGDPGLISEHAKIAGIPADPITEVTHIVRGFDFSNI